jgi:phospholipase C
MFRALRILQLTAHRLFWCIVAAGVSSGCSAPSDRGLNTITVRPAMRHDLGPPIKHVVVVIQENRSFENIFAGFPNADAPLYGYNHNGRQVNLRQVKFANALDPAHGFVPAIADWDNGKMDGFDTQSPGKPTFPYSYLERTSVEPYWTMAQTYVLADEMFPTEFGGSFAAHLNIVAGTDQLNSSQAEADNPNHAPWGCDAPAGTTSTIINTQRKKSNQGPFPCFTQFTTMADSLDNAGISWKYYAPQTIGCPVDCDSGGQLWSVFDAINNVRYGSDWTTKVINPETQILQDAANGNLASVSWVVPDWRNSDHAGSKSDTGPSWVASIVNAIGTSPYWKSTAVVVIWDDWGGWYDDSPPPQLDYEGLAIRVPCIIVSAYAKPAYVSHTQYEFGSILKYIEDTFNVPSLGHTDARAASLRDSFDYGQKPIAFKKITAKYPPSYFLHEKPSLRAPDDI